MTLRFYYNKYQAATGKLYYPIPPGGGEFFVWQDIFNDLLPYASQFPSGSQVFNFLVSSVRPYFRLTSPIDNLPFVRYPDSRYKLGSLLYSNGYLIDIDSEGIIRSKPIYGEDVYIKYPLQVMPDFVCASYAPRVGSGGASIAEITDYGVQFEDFTDPVNTTTFPYDPRRYAFTGGGRCYCGLSVALPDGIEGELVLYYSSSIGTTFGDDFVNLHPY